MVKTRIKYKELREVKSPSDRDITSYFLWINFKDLPDNISLDVNPRKPKMNTAVAKELIKAVKADDETFDINNRGMVITAKDLKINSDNSVTIDFDDNHKLYGILDGGHTYTAIIQNRDAISDDLMKEKFVKAEVIVGSDVDIQQLADARNTSLQVSDIALYELDDKFSFIKDSIDSESYGAEVAYKDNDTKPIPVADLLRLMFMFNIKRFPGNTAVPTAAYSSKRAVFIDYKKEYEKDDNIYKKLAPQLPKLIDLYEEVETTLPEMYRKYKKEEGKKSKFGGLRGVEVQKDGEGFTEFNMKEKNYSISNGFLFPIYGAFRALLEENPETGEITWKVDPYKVWNTVGVELVQTTFETGNNPQTVGKTKTLWQANYRIVDNAVKDIKIQELEAKLSGK